jgi:uncharacterized protein (TIGR03435 family)
MQRHTTRTVAGVLVAMITAVGLHVTAQEPAAQSAKAFDVVSVRRNTSGTTRSNIDRSPTGMTIVNQTLRPIVQLAYGISQPVRIVGLPEWANTDRFDVTARGNIGNLADFRVMMQAMLVDRFKLAAHTEQRNLPIFTLVMARSDGRPGPSLKTSSCPPVGLGAITGRGAAPPPAPAADAPPTPPCGLVGSGPGEITVAGINMETFVGFLSITQGRPIVDNTNLTGAYDIHIQFAPDPLPGRDPEPATEGRPSLLTALQEQLGLKLQPGTQPQEVLVIDRVERPDEN